MQCSSYVKLAPGVTADDLRAHLVKTFANEFFVKVGAGAGHWQALSGMRTGPEGWMRPRLPATGSLCHCPMLLLVGEEVSDTSHSWLPQVLDKNVVPHTRYVRGSNFCHIGVFEDRIAGRAVILSVIDNLVKGASGQAMQNLNLMLGLPETTALQQLAMFP